MVSIFVFSIIESIKYVNFFFTRKKFIPTRVIYEVLFATKLRRLRNPNESGTSANDVYTIYVISIDFLLTS